MEELIVVKQLPVIVEQFRAAGEEVSRRVAEADALICTEESKQAVKKARAALNKESAAYATRFKEVEAQILEPWNHVKNAYKEFISIPYADGDKRLKAKIDSIEKEQKQQKYNEIKRYFDEYRTSRNIDFVDMDTWHPNVTLTVSLTALKKEAKSYIDRICDDLALIQTQDFSTEILVEYRRSLNVSQAITTVTERRKAIAEQASRQNEIAERNTAEAEAVKRIEAAAAENAPTPLSPPVESAALAKYTVAFQVSETKDKLALLVAFMRTNDIEFTQISLPDFTANSHTDNAHTEDRAS